MKGHIIDECQLNQEHEKWQGNAEMQVDMLLQNNPIPIPLIVENPNPILWEPWPDSPIYTPASPEYTPRKGNTPLKSPEYTPIVHVPKKKRIESRVEYHRHHTSRP
jgi:hypothetical protein